jgi:hypothetical protein
MAVCTMEEAKAAQRAAAGKPPRSTGTGQNANANIATAQNTNNAGTNATTTTTNNPLTTTPPTPTPTTAVASANPTPIILNGVSYVPVAATTTPTQQTANLCDHTGGSYRDLLDFRGMVAELGSPDTSLSTSLDWEYYSKLDDQTDMEPTTSWGGQDRGSGITLATVPDTHWQGGTCDPQYNQPRHLRKTHS